MNALAHRQQQLRGGKSMVVRFPSRSHHGKAQRPMMAQSYGRRAFEQRVPVTETGRRASFTPPTKIPSPVKAESVTTTPQARASPSPTAAPQVRPARHQPLQRQQSIRNVSASVRAALSIDTPDSTEENTQARYDEMMERFQIRQLTRQPSNMSHHTAHGHHGSFHVSRSRRERDSIQRASSRRLSAVAPMLHGSGRPQAPNAKLLVHPVSLTPSWFMMSVVDWFVYVVVSPIHPHSIFNQVRQFVVVFCLFTQLLLLPLTITNVLDSWGFQSRTVVQIDLVIEAVLAGDVLFSFRTAYFDEDGNLVTGAAQIVTNYVKTWFFLDLLASIPVQLFATAWTTTTWPHALFDGVANIPRLTHVAYWFRAYWLSRLLRSGRQSVVAWMTYSRYSHLIRIVGIVLMIMLLAHYMACIWYMLGSAARREGLSSDVSELYVRYYYEVLQLLQGQGLPTTTMAQNIFASVAVLMGSILLAVVFGHVAMLVANFNANSTAYQRKLESVFSTVGKLRLPVPLRERIHQYYEHVYREYESLDGRVVQFSKELSHTLELEVVLFKYMELIMHIPFWQGCSPDFQKQLALHLQVRVYLPDDFVIRRGEVGDEFYMINRGVCELATSSDSVERATAPLEEDEGVTMTSPGKTRTAVQSKLDAGRIQLARMSSGSFNVSKEQEAATNRRKSIIDSIMGGHSQRGDNVTTLTRGQSFGEMALIMNYERTASCRASSYVEMCVLNRLDFQKILVRYGNDRRVVLSSIITTTLERNEQNHVKCPLTNLVRATYCGNMDQNTENDVTAQFAAARIVDAAIPELDDLSITFGISSKLPQRLQELREQKFATAQTGSHRANEAWTVVPARIAQELEDLKHMHVATMRALDEMKHQLAILTAEQNSKPAHENYTPKDVENPSRPTSARSSNRTTQERPPRHSMLVRGLSWTNLHKPTTGALPRAKSARGHTNLASLADSSALKRRFEQKKRTSSPYADLLFGKSHASADKNEALSACPEESIRQSREIVDNSSSA